MRKLPSVMNGGPPQLPFTCHFSYLGYIYHTIPIPPFFSNT